MSWKSRSWRIDSPGCDLNKGDKLTFSGTEVKVTRKGKATPDTPSWGTIVSESGDVLSVNADGGLHTITHLPGAGTWGTLKGEFGSGARILGRPRKQLRTHKHKDKHKHYGGPGDHTGATVVSWTAEEGG